MQKYQTNIKDRIKTLRAQGYTYSEIRTNLKINIPKSSLSYICKGIILPPSYDDKVKKLNKKNREKGREMAVEANKLIRQNYLRRIYDRNRYLSSKVDKDTLKIALAMLYLGEGAKWKGSRGLALGSSDPNIIRLYMKLLNICYNITTKNLKGRIQCRADQKEKKLVRFWSQITKIPQENFYKTYRDPRTVGKKTKKSAYKGVCTISGGGTEIQLELDAIAQITIKHICKGL